MTTPPTLANHVGNMMNMGNNMMHMGNTELNGDYFSRYFEMLVMTTVMTQFPQMIAHLIEKILDTLKIIFMCIYSRLYEWWNRKPIKELFRYSKSYQYSCRNRQYMTSGGSTRSDPDNQYPTGDILVYLLDYIVALKFDTLEELDSISYTYVRIDGYSYKIPQITEAIPIKDGVHLMWSVYKENRSLSGEQQDKNTTNTKDSLGNPGSMRLVREEIANITVTLYSNDSKTVLEEFEQSLVRARIRKQESINNYQTISFYHHKLSLDSAGFCGEQYWDTYAFKSTKSFDNLFLPERDRILHVLKTFCHNKAKYCRLGKQDYLGILLYGLPGCGKTSLIKAIANFTQRDLYILKLAEIKSDAELKSIFQDQQLNLYPRMNGISHGRYNRPFNKRIIVLEDIDVDIKCIEDREHKMDGLQDLTSMTNKISKKIGRILDKDDTNDMNPDLLKTLMRGMDDLKIDKRIEQYRNTSTYYNKFNLDVFLNILDGIQEQDGTIFIITTNYPDKIDRALLRPGRCDLRIEFGRAKEAVIAQMVEYYYQEEYHAEDFPSGSFQILDDRFTASETCQILYERSYPDFQEWLAKINREPELLDALVEEMRVPNVVEKAKSTEKSTSKSDVEETKADTATPSKSRKKIVIKKKNDVKRCSAGQSSDSDSDDSCDSERQFRRKIFGPKSMKDADLSWSSEEDD